MSNTIRVALALVLSLGTASAIPATAAFAAENYDADWAPPYSGPTVQSESKVEVHGKNLERFVSGPSERASHKTNGQR